MVLLDEGIAECGLMPQTPNMKEGSTPKSRSMRESSDAYSFV